MSAEAQQYKSTTKLVANAINMYLIYFQPTYGSWETDFFPKIN